MHNHPSWSTGEHGDEDYLIMIIDISIIDHLCYRIVIMQTSWQMDQNVMMMGMMPGAREKIQEKCQAGFFHVLR